ncbi:unnamed protein product, partial [marine sediment metagenome]
TTPFNLTMTEIAGTYTCIWTNTSAYDPAFYQITIWAQDENGNVNQSQFIVIRLQDIDPPSVSGITPADLSSYELLASIEINATVSDIPSSTLIVMAKIVNGSDPFNLAMIEIAGTYTCTWTNTSEYDPGFYNLTIWAQDESGNVNQTQYITIKLEDTTAPSVTGITPADLSSYELPLTVEINATVSDVPSSTLIVMAMIVNGSDPFNLAMTEIAGTYTCT